MIPVNTDYLATRPLPLTVATWQHVPCHSQSLPCNTSPATHSRYLATRPLPLTVAMPSVQCTNQTHNVTSLSISNSLRRHVSAKCLLLAPQHAQLNSSTRPHPFCTEIPASHTGTFGATVWKLPLPTVTTIIGLSINHTQI
jgi:hypothetical protein